MKTKVTPKLRKMNEINSNISLLVYKGKDITRVDWDSNK